MLEKVSTEELQKELNRRMAAKSKAKKRYEITGIWSGYSSGQAKIVHREYTADKSFVDSVTSLKSIEFTDGTYLSLRIRPMAYKEKKQKDIRAYSEVIRNCIEQNTNKVSDLK